ncbi:RNA-directed DNA polymerase, eukaryota [Tanacetum coccineum]
MMGDFNEVRYKSDRFGSNFNAHGADIFNNFIINSGLEEVPLGGSAYTWCHKSASKMSKLDRFLVSENLLNTCPNISAITLDRFLSDHRPILLREASFDYGPTPFRFFHFWFDVDGFDKFVTDSWKDAPGDDSNAMRNLCGNGSDEIVNNRLDILGKLQQQVNNHASEVAQKQRSNGFGPNGDDGFKTVLNNSAKGQILSKGYPYGGIQFYKGLKQVDPLSPPFLYLSS